MRGRHRRAALPPAALGLAMLIAACGSAAIAPSLPASHGVAADVLRTRPQLDPPDASAAASPTAPLAREGAAATAGRGLANYTVVYRFAAPSVGIDIPVITVGITAQGAMDAPEGAPSNPVWREGFWLDRTARPGIAGTATIAGHLDDTAGRPAGFWTLRQIKAGALVQVTRLSDGVVVTYRITEVDVYTLQQANSPAVLGRLFGAVGGGTADGVARLSLITCTGRFVHGEYDHRFVAYAEMVSAT